MRNTPTQGETTLVRETVDRQGDQVGRHAMPARLELAADLRSLGKRLGVIAALAAVTLIGYTLTMLGLAACIGGIATVGKSLLAIGLVHVAGGGGGLVWVLARVRETHLMDATT